MSDLEKSERLEHLVRKTVKTLIEIVRKVVYLPEYQQQTSEEEILGVIVAKYCEWTSDRILKVFSSALEDANYSDLSAKVDSWIK